MSINHVLVCIVITYISYQLMFRCHLSTSFDYLNDWRDGYNGSTVFSYCLGEYRLTMVMTFRRDMGSSIDKL